MKKVMLFLLNYFIGGVIMHKVDKEDGRKPSTHAQSHIANVVLYSLVVPASLLGVAEGCMEYIANRLPKRG